MLQKTFYEWDQEWRKAWAGMSPEQAERTDQMLANFLERQGAMIARIQGMEYRPPHIRLWHWITRHKDEDML